MRYIFLLPILMLLTSCGISKVGAVRYIYTEGGFDSTATTIIVKQNNLSDTIMHNEILTENLVLGLTEVTGFTYYHGKVTFSLIIDGKEAGQKEFSKIRKVEAITINCRCAVKWMDLDVSQIEQSVQIEKKLHRRLFYY